LRSDPVRLLLCQVKFQLNRAIHIIALLRARTDPETRAYLDRKHTEGKTKLEAIRCLKRHLARRIWRLLHTAEISAAPPVLINGTNTGIPSPSGRSMTGTAASQASTPSIESQRASGRSATSLHDPPPAPRRHRSVPYARTSGRPVPSQRRPLLRSGGLRCKSGSRDLAPGPATEQKRGEEPRGLTAWPGGTTVVRPAPNRAADTRCPSRPRQLVASTRTAVPRCAGSAALADCAGDVLDTHAEPAAGAT